jgi:signal transduction histidine kinase
MVDMAHPLLAIFLCYYFFIPYRLIIENRRSWEYYQKHKILSEVEQLKTNFIGMMSHDLKTPLARIQGMTEVIAKDPSPMSSQQREALDLIKQSAEDLTRFISAILNYAKIESQGVALHLQSKDINLLLEEVMKKNEFMARLKQIQMVAELEPLFSIPVDPDLVKQVLSNLIENAIKYSPENSKVLISSEEKDGKILIQVADQGVGIPQQDLEHVFMKFFRSASAKSSAVKGSGLGLYLAKYFVELHKGHIFVESTPGQGSTFTVELPTSAT